MWNLIHIIKRQNIQIDLQALHELILFSCIILFFIVFMRILVQLANAKLSEPIKIPVDDDFYVEHGYSFDYVFVFRVWTEEEKAHLSSYQIKYSMKNIIERINLAGLESRCFYSCQRDEIYVKLRCPPARLLAEANRIQYKILLDPQRLRLRAQSGKRDLRTMEYKWKPIQIIDEHDVTSLEPWDFIYGPYRLNSDIQTAYSTFPMAHQKWQMLKNSDR